MRVLRVLFQIGFTKSRKKNQSISAYINGEKINWENGKGVFLTNHKDRVYRNTIWFMYESDLEKEDILKLEVKTFLPGIGQDDEKTFDVLYYADEDVPVRSIDFNGVGKKGYPVLKGRFLEISSVSKEDERKASVEEFLNEEF